MEVYKGIKWFIYARKSEDDRDKQVQSIEGQVQELHNLQNKMGGLKIIDIIKEEESAKGPGREKFNNMIRRIKRGESNGLLIWAYHRLSRNPVDDGTIQWLLQNGTLKAIKTIDRVYLPGDNALLLRIEGGTANQFILDLQRNVLRGLKQKIEKGWKPGKAPLGYLNTKTEANGDNYIIKDPERFALMRKAWDMMLTGKYTPSQILEVMNTEWGVRTIKTKREGGKPLSRSSLYRIFSDVFYTGLFTYNGQLHEGKHEPMITLDEFDRVQLLLGKEGRPRPKKHIFTYTGIMTCAVCGSAVTASEKTKLLKTTGEMKTYVFYHCTKRKKSAIPCNQYRNLPVKQLEELILEELQQCTISKEFRDWAMEIIESENNDIKEAIINIQTSQQRALESTEHELENLTSLRVRDLINDDEFLKHKKAFQEKLIILKQKISETSHNTKGWQEYLSGIFDFSSNVVNRFKKGTEEEKKDILFSLGWNHSLKDGKLFVCKAKWLEPIKKVHDAVDAEICRLELRNKLTVYERNDVFSSFRPLLLALVDDVRTDYEMKREKEKQETENIAEYEYAEAA
jgi:site-specific DNA recombinase